MTETAILKLDKDYTISLGVNEWVEFEKISDKNALMDNIFANISMTTIVQLVYSCLKYCDECNYTIEECGSLLNWDNLKDVTKTLAELHAAGIPEAKKGAIKKK
ncbi:MAG: hypothetical protein V3V72_13710 [Ignavibacteriaceae bacterium]